MRTSLTEFVGGLSLATDMGAGLPLQSAISATILATRMARRFGLSSEETRETFYSSILRFIGCSAAAPEAAQLGLGDDAALNYALSICDLTDSKQVTASIERHAAPHASAEERRALARSLPEQLGVVAAAAAMHCTQAVLLSRRLPVGEGVLESLGHMYDRFDGKLSRVSGHAIPMPARLASLAAHTAIMLRSLGRSVALEVVMSRRGGQFCAECCDLLEADHASLFAGLDAPSCWDAYLDSAPEPNVELEGDTLERACTAYADYADQKSGFLLGHSRRVAGLTFVAAESVGLDLGDRRRLRLAAMLHDVGRAGVPAGLWDKKASFTEHERQLVRAHSALTETVLKLAPGLSGLGESATHVHERGDRSGYPRSATLSDVGAGLLAAADVYEALTHDRPWRQAYAPTGAADMMLDEARAGRIPRRAVDAVLGAAGHGKRRSEGAYPAGLSRREVEVLALLAQGLSTKEIAARISVAPKTAENHITNIYAKTGVRGRASAALFAVEHGLHHQDHDG